MKVSSKTDLLKFKDNLLTFYHIVSDARLLLGGLISSKHKIFDFHKVTLTLRLHSDSLQCNCVKTKYF